jgi:hypothetical protein
MREVEAYRRFKHPNIIRILDSAVVQDPEGEGQIVYLFLPLYKVCFDEQHFILNLLALSHLTTSVAIYKMSSMQTLSTDDTSPNKTWYDYSEGPV